MARHPHIVNVTDVPPTRTKHGERFAAERRSVTGPAGGDKLGCSFFRVPPGKTAFPAHRHHGNEEALYVLSGEGLLRLDDAEHPLGPGDYVALPAGGPAHQLRATGSAPLEYLCVSTMIHPDVVEYPDSGKIGAMAGAAPGGDSTKRRLRAFFKAGTDVDYYEGEEG